MRRGLLVVDLQEGFYPPRYLVKRIQEAARIFDAVVQTRFKNGPSSLYRRALQWEGDGGALVKVVETPVVLDKAGYGLSSEHIDALKALGCDQWHLCGLETDACVLACAFSLWDAEIRPRIELDLCTSPLHNEALPIIRRQFGREGSSAHKKATAS